MRAPGDAADDRADQRPDHDPDDQRAAVRVDREAPEPDGDEADQRAEDGRRDEPAEAVRIRPSRAPASRPPMPTIAAPIAAP